jgi:hypothetical protein
MILFDTAWSGKKSVVKSGKHEGSLAQTPHRTVLELLAHTALQNNLNVHVSLNSNSALDIQPVDDKEVKSFKSNL